MERAIITPHRSQQDLVLLRRRDVVDHDSTVIAERREAPGVVRGPGSRIHTIFVIRVRLDQAVDRATAADKRVDQLAALEPAKQQSLDADCALFTLPYWQSPRALQ